METPTEQDRAEAAEAFLRTRADAEIRNLNQEHPLVINDGENPTHEFARQIHAEGKRRGIW